MHIYIQIYSVKSILLQFSHLLFQHGLEAERLESNTFSDKVLTHSLDPVQTQRVQHSRGTFHDNQDCNGEEEPTKRCISKTYTQCSGRKNLHSEEDKNGNDTQRAGETE